VAIAIAKAIEETPLSPEHIEEVAGRGIRGECQGGAYLLGSATLFEEHQIPLAYAWPSQSTDLLTVAFFGQDRQCLTAIVLGDQIRQGAQELIAHLKPARSILLSGDTKFSVETVAAACGFDDWRWGCNPLQKREHVLEWKRKGHVVCMLGDGINDAPALTAADVGISVVSAADMSIQVSDILLTTDLLSAVSAVRTAAKKGQTILKQNLFWAFSYNIAGVFLAAFGVLSPIFAACAMTASSLMVLFNARRI
jgi:Cu2+-exporting ATPase